MLSGATENVREYSAPIYSGEVIIDTLDITETQSVNRYLYRADLMYAYRIGKISLGAGMNYYLGHDIRRFRQAAGFGIFDTFEKTEQTYKNPPATIGMTADLDKIAVGAYYSVEATLEGAKVRSSIHETEDLGNFSIPFRTRQASA
ncbi:MAG: hypothetical protein MZV63_14955 [Marinilabiliales bacterium]|nr:hypothetical protein [Marinilabiliales bacterium]